MKRALGAALVAAFLFSALPARADVAAGKKKAGACVTCHGPEGNSASGEYPILAGQTARYLYLQLKDFKEGRRSNGLMAPFLEKHSRDDMLDLADYFAAQKPKPIAFRPDAERVAGGEEEGRQVPCTRVHLGREEGQEQVPRVAGQPPELGNRQVKAFKARKGTKDPGKLARGSQTISEQDIEDLAHYIA